MRHFLMSAKSTGDGLRYTWLSDGSPDFAAVGYSGPPSPTNIYVQSFFDDAAEGAPGAPGAPGAGINLRSPRTSVRGTATANLNTAAPVSTTQNGITYSANQSIFLRAQTTQTQNGFYVFGTVSGGTASLTKVDGPFAACFATGSGMRVHVREGGDAGKQFLINSARAVAEDTAQVGLPWLEVDLEDFYVSGDGTDYSPAFHRAQAAMRCNNANGKCYARRQSFYNFATPLQFTLAMDLVGNGGTLKNATQLNYSKGGAYILGGNREFDGALTDAAGVKLEELLMLGPNSLAASRWDGVYFCCQLFARNVAIQNFPGRAFNGYASTSHDYGSINTTTSANFTQPAAGATVNIQFTSGATLIAGAIVRISGGGAYLIEALVSGTTYTCQNIGFAYDTAYAVANAPAGTAIGSGAVVRGVFGNIDLSSIEGGRAASNGLTGVYINGDNANACYFRGIDLTSNGLRVVRGDNHGSVDSSFLGNTWVMMHASGNNNHFPLGVTTTANFNLPTETLGSADYGALTVTISVTSTAGMSVGQRIAIEGAGTIVIVQVVDGTTLKANFLRHTSADGFTVTSGKNLYDPAYAYLCEGSGAYSIYVGCYAESTDVSKIDLPSQVQGGRIGNIGNAARYTTDTVGVGPRNTYWRNKGKFQTVLEVGNAGTDRIMAFSCDTNPNSSDTGGFVFAYDDDGTGNAIKGYSWLYGGSLYAGYLTGSAFGTYGGGFFGFPRGFLIGGKHRFQMRLDANLPTVSTSTDFYQVGDMIVSCETATSGAWFYKVTAKDGSNNLTLKADRRGFKNQSMNFGASVANNATATQTKTLTGVAVGDNVIANPRAALPDGVVIAQCRISAANTVEVKLLNLTGGNVDLSATTWDFTSVAA